MMNKLYIFSPCFILTYSIMQVRTALTFRPRAQYIILSNKFPSEYVYREVWYGTRYWYYLVYRRTMSRWHRASYCIIFFSPYAHMRPRYFDMSRVRHQNSNIRRIRTSATSKQKNNFWRMSTERVVKRANKEIDFRRKYGTDNNA